MVRSPQDDAQAGGGGSPLSEAQLDAEMNVSSASILVVDDHEQNLELLQAYLEDIGCRVRIARDGLEAMREVEREQPDLILLDVMMPKMSGFQLCTRLKTDPETRDIPIVMVTALSEIGDAERAVESGANEFLTKPVHKIELLLRVKPLLRLRLLKKQMDEALRRDPRRER